MTVKSKWGCPIKKIKKKSKYKKYDKKRMKDTSTQINNSDSKFLKPWNTFWAYEFFFFIANNHSLHYMFLNFFFNQLNKQLGSISGTLKIRKRVMISWISYSLFYMLIKWVLNKRKKNSQQSLKLPLEPFALKLTKKWSFNHIASAITNLTCIKGQIILSKKINPWVMTKCFKLTSGQFLFSNARKSFEP